MAGRSNGASRRWCMPMCLFALVVLVSVMASSSLRASAARAAGFQLSQHMAATQLRELEQVDKPAAVSESAAKVDPSPKPADDDDDDDDDLVPASVPGSGPGPIVCLCADKCPNCVCAEGDDIGFVAGGVCAEGDDTGFLAPPPQAP